MRRARETVQYKPLFGAFRKIPRDRARALILADYDRSPLSGTALLRESLNCRLAYRHIGVSTFMSTRVSTVENTVIKIEEYSNSKRAYTSYIDKHM